jgi:aminoglycoside/choline kinase family phosphotransferase
VDAHAGTTGRALIELNGAPDLPARLFVKLPPGDNQQRLFVTSTGMGRREALFYRQLSDEVPMRVPRCYHADSNATGDRYIMLLENLADSGCTFRNASSHYSLAYVRRVLSSFARLHARYWKSDRFSGDLDWVQSPLQHEIAVNLVGLALRRHREEMPRVFSQMAESYLSNADRVHSLWLEGPQTLIHGDVHDGNLFLDNQEPGFLDWAILARGPGMRDVAYFLAGTLQPEHRELARELIGEYRGQLLAAGCDAPLLDELWLQYRRHVAYVWVGAVTTLAMGDAWQPTAYVRSTLERIHAVMERVNTVAAL